jgi:hypothetical protein
VIAADDQTEPPRSALRKRNHAMAATTKRSTIYFEAGLHEALRLKATHTHRSISDIVNDAVRVALDEDLEDLAAFEERGADPVLAYEELLNELKSHGKL